MLLSAEHLSINFGSRQLLDDVNFYLNEGDKVGVIGINGTGKSTFLKVLSGVTEPDGGTVSRNPNVQISLLSQNPVMDENATVLEQVFLHFPAEFRALNEYEAKAMLNRLGITDFCPEGGHPLRRTAEAGGPGGGPHPPGGRADPGRAHQPPGQRDGGLAGGLAPPVQGRPRHGDPRPVLPGAGGEPHHGALPGKAVPLRGQLFQVPGAAGAAAGDGGGQRAQAPVHPPGGAGVDHAGLQGPHHQVQGAHPAVRGPAGPGRAGDGRGRPDGGGLQPPGEEDHRAARRVQVL